MVPLAASLNLNPSSIARMIPQENRTIVGRLAPSPTGGLHIGHARTFLVAWLAARSAGGRIILRIEDIDASRARPESIEASIADLRWLGLDWDEGPDVGGPNAPYLQSMRKLNYQAALDRLKAQERVYPCTCSRAEIARASSAPHPGEEGTSYLGTCAYRRAADAESLSGRSFCWRFRVPFGQIWWDDLVRGMIAGAPHANGGDFIVGRSSGEPAYQLAVVCDDAAMGVNQVVRGDDLISSTPRQILLYLALGLPEPEFGHVPLVLDADGQRLAKRDGSIKLAALRDSGVDPGRLVAILANSCGLAVSRERIRPDALIQAFLFEGIPKAPWIVEMAGSYNE
ncbi:MAG: gltX2 [Planctomycetota bacterium]|nr:gltX2 [Planctomycetota bacterium]